MYLLCPEMAKLYRDIWEEKKAEFYVFKERKEMQLSRHMEFLEDKRILYDTIAVRHDTSIFSGS